MEMVRVADSAGHHHQSHAVVLDQHGGADDGTVQHEKPKEKEGERPQGCTCANTVGFFKLGVCCCSPLFQRGRHVFKGGIITHQRQTAPRMSRL